MSLDRGPVHADAGSGRGRTAIAFVLDNLVSISVIAASAAFSALIPKFFQIGILLSILEQSTFVVVIAVGLSLTLISGHMDLF